VSDSNITKQALAIALKEVMEEKPFEKIVITDIVEKCNLNRQTFYYHFKDKYDLMNWIYYTETTGFISEYYIAGNWTDGICALCCYMQENKKFYTNALSTSGQNSFSKYLIQYIHDIFIALIQDIKGIKNLDDKSLDFLAEFIATGFVGLIARWAKGGMKEDPKEFIEYLKSIIDNSMYKSKYLK